MLKANPIPTEAINTAEIRADNIDNSPDGMGLFYFVGWFISNSTSTESLNKYIAELIKTKLIKALKLVKNISKNSFNTQDSLNENIIGKKITKFLTHCLGREDFKIATKKLIMNTYYLKNLFFINVKMSKI